MHTKIKKQTHNTPTHTKTNTKNVQQDNAHISVTTYIHITHIIIIKNIAPVPSSETHSKCPTNNQFLLSISNQDLSYDTSKNQISPPLIPPNNLKNHKLFDQFFSAGLPQFNHLLALNSPGRACTKSEMNNISAAHSYTHNCAIRFFAYLKYTQVILIFIYITRHNILS